MTTLAPPRTTGEAAQRPPRPFGALVGAAALAAVVGLALGRFALAGSAPAPAASSPAGPSEALAAAERAVTEAPGDLAALQRLGLAANNAAIATGDPALYGLAQDAYARADALQADHPDTLVGRGKLALSLHDFPTALELGERAVAARPGSAPSLGVLVDAQVELGRYDAAAATLQRLLDTRPDLAALARASYLRELHGDLDGAALALRQAEAAGAAAGGASMDLATVRALSGDLALRRGDVRAAEAHYERAAEAAPDLPAVAVGRARVLAARGELSAAADLLGEAADGLPSPPVVILHADLLRAAGRGAEARDADEVVRALADVARASGQVVDLEMARFEADRGSPDAVALARAAYDARPDNVFAADALAWALHRAGDRAAALPLVEQALRLGGADPGMRGRAALILAGAGEPDRARAELTAAFAGPPLAALAHHADLRALAGRLDVEVPQGWS